MPPSPNIPATAIVWFRRDLRLADNLALHAALSAGGHVICVYIREPEEPYAGALGAAQAWWLHHSLVALDKALRKKKSGLIFRSGHAKAVLSELIEETEAKAVFWNRRYDPSGIAVDSALKTELRLAGIDARSFNGFLMHEPSKLLTKEGRRYSVYTPFWRAFETQFVPHDALPSPDHIPSPDVFPESEDLDDWNLLPTNPDWAKDFPAHWQPGEDGALRRLDDFIENGLAGYKTDRDFPSKPAVSGLSPHLALGEISPHRIWNATQRTAADGLADDVTHFRKELVWREFSWHLLFHIPDMASVNIQRRFDAFAWLSDKKGLRAWQRGMTGYPIVDAGMRELWQTGVMHNRVRMIVASFLIKDLLIDWRDGEAWFRDTLLDADRASNTQNWQWVAGSGADASPWFRIFNPVTQGEKFDPQGTYVRQYCPEIAGLSDRYIHRPFDAPKADLEKAGIVLGETYPEPLVAHDFARRRALDALRAISEG